MRKMLARVRGALSGAAVAVLVVAIVAIVVAVVVFCPLVTIWSLNTLFGTEIGYSLATWFATVWLGAFLMHHRVSSKK
jgi:hypothetical protein